MQYVACKEKTIGDLYEVYSACELTIRDHDDNVMVWHGDFEDMPIKYAGVVFQKCTVHSYDAEMEVII